ncbi:DUF4917 family protein [Vibrio splendidus]|uniref:DUF4917 family protein n=1 Tax=Vibrio splendidus TaxID=29497 RepID=UPI000D34CD7B|nr:DUF4917 family protein [Vibrio splendidus]PTP77850.1 hypothetical protein CWO06_07270 [Vibrio splendidus]
MFQELLDDCIGERSLLLGNGFGISFDAAMNEDNFNWDSLLDLCEIEEGTELHQLLVNNRFDFELVHQKINSCIDVLDLYAPVSPLQQHLATQIEYLREQLVIAVSRSHPSSFSQPRRGFGAAANLNRKINNCRNFLNGFNTIYSLNYDLLLYWIRCHRNQNIGRDSFTRLNSELVFSPDNQANYFFPHGALFLYRDGVSATKSGSSERNPILARLESNIANGKFPMCISEGTGEQKLDEIKKNHYLLYAYNRIKDSRGSIFTFGCSFLEGKDSHIIEAMCLSGVDRIIVGEFNPSPATEYRLNHEFAIVQERLGTNKQVIIANTQGAQIW